MSREKGGYAAEEEQTIRQVHYVLRALSPREKPFTAGPRSQLCEKGGRIGFWTGRYDEKGQQCAFAWTDGEKRFNTYGFLQNETGMLVGMNSRMLKTFDLIQQMCDAHPEACYPDGTYGFRVTGEEYSYLFICRLDLSAKYQFRIHCYETERLDEQADAASPGMAGGTL